MQYLVFDFLKPIKAELGRSLQCQCHPIAIASHTHTCIVCCKMKWHCRSQPMMVTKSVLEQLENIRKKIVQCFLEACGIKCYNKCTIIPQRLKNIAQLYLKD